MNNIPEILQEFYNAMPVYQSNADELTAIWQEYLDSLSIEFPELSIDHDGDSVFLGELSPGCLFCKNGEWDCSFITPECNLHCEFCISPFLYHIKTPISAYGKTLSEIIINYKKIPVRGISFSGGEPFINFRDLVHNLQILKQELPDNYYWLYTNGILVHQEHIDILADLGIDEIRFNTAATGYTDEKIIRIMEYCSNKISNVTVEIPVIYKDREKLLYAIPDYKNAGVKYINLHELLRENNTPSQHLKNENFKKFTFRDGHTADISLDSKFLVKEIISRLIASSATMNLNFCSTINKLRQIRKRRNNMIRLLKANFEKELDEECLETVFAYRDKNTFLFIHPDDWQSRQAEYKDYSAVLLKKIAPLSISGQARIISVKKI